MTARRSHATPGRVFSMTDLDGQEREVWEGWHPIGSAGPSKREVHQHGFEAGFRAALAAREEPTSDVFQPGLALIDVERQLARVTQERDQDRDPHHPDSLACRVAEAQARVYALTQAVNTREKAREDAAREDTEADQWAEDEWHTDGKGNVIGGAPANFVFVAKSTREDTERPDETNEELQIRVLREADERRPESDVIRKAWASHRNHLRAMGDVKKLRELVRAAAPFVEAVAAMADDKAPSLGWLADAALAVRDTEQEHEVKAESRSTLRMLAHQTGTCPVCSRAMDGSELREAKERIAKMEGDNTRARVAMEKLRETQVQRRCFWYGDPPQARPSHRGRQPVSPRRWKLHVSMRGDRGFSGPVVSTKGFVPVREDIITEEDVEAVAERLAEIDRGEHATEYATGYKDEARNLLLLVLGSDKEGEDG
jgi:hypothetical protein